MAIEAEATDILLRLTLEGVEYFFRFTGKTAGKAVALLSAGVKALYEKKAGKQKLGGKVNTRSFLQNFSASTVFPLKKSELEKLKPEMKRLHIPYMQYKQSKDMKLEQTVELSVRKEDALRFQRLCEKVGIATVPYDFNAEELTKEDYEKMMQQEGPGQVNVTVGENGISIDETENPTPAQADRGPLSAQQSRESSIDGFNPSVGIKPNLDEAKAEALEIQKDAARRDGRLIPITANKQTLLKDESETSVRLTIPGTKKQEHLVVPKSDIVTMNANGGKTIQADLRLSHLYSITDDKGNLLRKETGAQIRDGSQWKLPERKNPIKSSPIKRRGAK